MSPDRHRTAPRPRGRGKRARESLQARPGVLGRVPTRRPEYRESVAHLTGKRPKDTTKQDAVEALRRRLGQSVNGTFSGPASERDRLSAILMTTRERSGFGQGEAPSTDGMPHPAPHRGLRRCAGA
jgi:hypothetical protein